MVQPKDVVLVERALAGDLTAFEVLYKRHSASIFRTIQAVVRNRPTAEDLLQECFVRAYRNLHRVDLTVDSLAPWLHRIALNLSYNKVSRRKVFFLDLDVIANIFASPLLAPDRLAEQSEVRRALAEAIEQLDENHRLVIVLHYLQELSVSEISTYLHVPKGTVKSRLHYARKKLRLALNNDLRVAHLVAAHGI